MRIFFSLIFLLLSTGSFAQNYLMDGSPVTDCGGYFLDSGGNNGNYGNNEFSKTVICPDTLEGTHVQLSFSGVDLELGDELCFFDSTDASYTSLLACASDFLPGAPFKIQASAANSTGCLTLVFSSDASGQADGWSAAIKCIPACQLIQSILVGTEPSAIPSDNGWIDICAGDEVSFEGKGFYKQNNLLYYQSDSLSGFEWDFGDGNFGYGPSVKHIYKEEGGYTVQLRIRDQFNCTNTNFISQRVRVAPRPVFSVGQIPEQICTGDTINLSSGLFPDTALVTASSSEAQFSVKGVRADSLDLPDGDGEVHQTSISFNEFSPGQILNDINDLLNICVNMEHSWMHDLEISITCPSGNKVILQNQQEIVQKVYLGIPNTNDEGFDPPIQGLGSEYCWTPDATAGTWTSYANNFYPNKIDLPAGNYNSWEGLEGLLGCPLNGDWTITVIDYWGQDNGWIFSWGISFNPEIYPNIETFQPSLVDYKWVDNPSMISNSPDSIRAAPQNAGTANYIFQVTDDFGCTFDTSIQISVLPPTHPECYDCRDNLNLEDTLVCAGSTVILNEGAPAALNQSITFEAHPNYIFNKQNHPTSNPYSSSIRVNSINPLKISDPLTDISSICVDVSTTGWVSDLRIVLRAPSGQVLLLTDGNGGGGNHYSNTCFTPGAATPITSGAAPFSGDFQPQGNWSSLANAAINGDWVIEFSDCCGNTDFNTIHSWSVSFNNRNNISYSWSDSSDLSCLDCPSPEAATSQTAVYMVETVDSYNCQVRDSVTVGVLNEFIAPEVVVSSSSGGTVTFSWNNIEGATAYEVNINNSDWIPANGSLSHTASGFMSGDLVHIDVRAVSDPQLPCQSGIGSEEILVCHLETTLVQLSNVSCNGLDDGTVRVEALNTSVVPNFILDGSLSQDNGDFIGQLPAGPHEVVVDERNGCRDTLVFSIDEPPPLQIVLGDTPISCYGESDGAVAVTEVRNNQGEVRYQWSANAGGQTTPGISGLQKGWYVVEVADGRGCMVSDSIELTEPEAMTVGFEVVHNQCFNANQGIIVANPSGGQPEYEYLWSNGESEATLSDLDGGIYFLQLTDANNCTITDSVAVEEPPKLELNASISEVLCAGDENGSIQLIASGGSGIYLYSFEGANFSNVNHLLGLGAGSYTAIVSDSKGCQDTITVDLVDPVPFEVSAGPDVVLSDGESATLDGIYWGNTGQVQFQWLAPYPGTLCCNGGKDCTEPIECLNPLSTASTTIVYELYAIDGKGCEASDEVKVSVVKDRRVLVPTGFTPNSDQNNDLFLVHGKSGTKVLLFRVYSRWGELLFEASNFEVNDPAIGWNGTYKGKIMNSDVYVWYLEVAYADGARESLKGEVSLIR